MTEIPAKKCIHRCCSQPRMHRGAFRFSAWGQAAHNNKGPQPNQPVASTPMPVRGLQQCYAHKGFLFIFRMVKKKKPCEQLSLQSFAQLTSNQWPSSFLETQLLFGPKTCSFPGVFSSASFHPWGSHHHHLWRIGTLPTGALRAGLRASQAFHRT